MRGGMWREQAVRDELYKGQEIENLKYISEKSAGIIYDDEQSGHSLRNEYMTLYMMLFWGVYNDLAYGYRHKERFRLFRLEWDHKKSNKG